MNHRDAEPGAASSDGASWPPLALYVHFPWCVRKCPYCDFNSHARPAPLPEAAYLETLVRDLDVQLASQLGRASAIAARPIESVFLGGGTPSLFSPGAIERLIAGLRERLRFVDDTEITLEANPGTLERGRFAGYRDAGVTRVSLGAQSFDPEALHTLGRIHSPDDTRRAAEELHAVGLANFNLDLMYGLPRHGAAEALRDVESALALEPAHLSHYALTLEPGTPFAARPPPELPDEDTVAESLQRCEVALASAGFERYEVSAWARPGRRCRHNLNYWSFGDYVGLGAGAHGKLSVPIATPAAGGPRRGDWSIHRTTRPRDPRRHAHAITESAMTITEVAAAELPFEFMLNALRLTEGSSLREFESRTGLQGANIDGPLRSLAARGLLAWPAPGRFAPTSLGLRFLNELLLAFMPAGDRKPRRSTHPIER